MWREARGWESLLGRESLFSESLLWESLFCESLFPESLFLDSVFCETVFFESVRPMARTKSPSWKWFKDGIMRNGHLEIVRRTSS